MDTFRDAPEYFWGVLQCCKKKPKLPKTVSAEPTGPEPVQHIEIMLPGSGAPGRPKPLRLSWDFSNQHTIKWEEPICVYMWDDEVNDKVAVTIRPGSCNLYGFPKVYWAKPAAPKGKGLGALISSAVAAAFAVPPRSFRLLRRCAGDWRTVVDDADLRTALEQAMHRGVL